MAEISLAICGDQATLACSAVGRTRLAQTRDLITLSQDERVPLENTQKFIYLCFNFLALQRPTERARDVNA